MASIAQRHFKPARWLVLIALFAASTGLGAGEPRPVVGPSVAMTLDVEWSPVVPRDGFEGGDPGAKAGVDLSLTSGGIIEAIAWPIGGRDGPLAADPASAPQAGSDGSWKVGTSPRGKVRLRVDAPLTSELIIRVGDQSARITLSGLLEGVQKGTTGGLQPTEVAVERLPWDAIQAILGTEDGTAEAAAAVPLELRFNILTPEPAEVAVRCAVELRPIGGGEPVWRQEWREVVATNSPVSPLHPLSLTMPGPEGTYLLEVRTDWEPLGDPAGTRLGRWVRRRRNPAQITSATRRLTLAVVNSRTPAPVPLTKADGSGIEVDAIDLNGNRATAHRPSASGRAPGDPLGRWGWAVPDSALVAPAFRDRVRGWIGRAGGELATLAPSDGLGLAWSAIGLRVPHPDRPHRLTVTVTGGHPAALGVAMVAEGGTTAPSEGGPGGRNRVVLDACAAGSPIFDGGAPASFSWPVWPGNEAPVVVLVNRNPAAPVQIGSITLTELGDLPPASTPRESDRALGIHLASVRELDRFGGIDASGRIDPLTQARNLATYLIHTGASTAVLPDGLSDRAARRGLSGQADEDATGPDRLDLTLRVLARRNCSAWVDVPFEGSIAGLPPVDSPEAATAGLLRVDRHGRPDGLAYQPIHPKVREAMARKVADAVRIRQTRPNLIGALVRLGAGSTLPGGPDSGLDDATYARFITVFEAKAADKLQGRGTGDPLRFETRARFVEAGGKLPWLAWRAREVAAVYSAMSDAARRAAPGAILAVATPGLDAGLAGVEARRIDMAGLGPVQAWRGVGLDLSVWPTGDGAPVVLRATGLSTDDLAHDLATSPELDEPVAARAGRGSLIGVEGAEVVGPGFVGPAGPRLVARPMAEGSAGDEPLGHSLAAIDAGRVFVAASSAVGQEDRLRHFARVFASLPGPAPGVPGPRLPSGVVARPIRAGAVTFLALSNDSPYPILLETKLGTAGHPAVDDLGRGIRLDPDKEPNALRVVIELAPFGVAATRVSAPDVRLVSVTPHSSTAVIEGMKAQFDDLSIALARLNRLHTGGPTTPRATGPANSGFEPDSVELATAKVATVGSWDLSGEAAASELDRDRPHAGRASLRLDARTGPAAITSAPFHPEARSSLLVRGWLRADRPDARVRVRIEGQSAHRGYLRQFDVPVRGEWSEVVVRAPQLPDGGLDSARVRFELLAPGRLWVDDVSVVGDMLDESERLNARRDLMAALEFYREQRYADFARLAGSHWVRHVAGAAASATVAGDRSGVIRTGDAISLPAGRRLR